MASITRLTDRKSGVRWKLKWRDSAGRQNVRIFRRKIEAEHHRDTVITERMTGRERDVRAGRKTFGEVWDEVHAAREYAPATLDLHRFIRERYLRPLENARLSTITSAQVSRLLDLVERPGMREKVRQTLSGVFAWAVDHGRLAVNPARRRGRDNTRAARTGRKDARAPSPDERYSLETASVWRLADAVPPRYRALILVMGFAGLRPGEARGLRVRDVGTSLTVSGSMTPTGRGPTKTGESRVIPLPGFLHRALEEHKVKWADPLDGDRLLFSTSNGTPVGKDNLRSLVARAAEKAAVSPVPRPNWLRHHFASWAVAEGATVIEVQRFMGHAKPSITLDTYSRLFEGSLEELAERLDEAVSR